MKASLLYSIERFLMSKWIKNSSALWIHVHQYPMINSSLCCKRKRFNLHKDNSCNHIRFIGVKVTASLEKVCMRNHLANPQMTQRTHNTACILQPNIVPLLHIHQPLLSGPALHPQVRLIIPSPAPLSWGACCQFIRLSLLIFYFPQCKHHLRSLQHR